MNQLLKLELDPIINLYRRGSLDIEGEESYRNWIASKCEKIPRDDFRSVVAILVQDPPRVRPSHKVYFALWSKIQGEQAKAYREKVRAEKESQPEVKRWEYGEQTMKMLKDEMDTLKRLNEDPDKPFM